MSRGYWDYRDEQLCSEIFGWVTDKEFVPNVFGDTEISEVIFDVFKLLYAFDSYKCGDWSKNSWNDAKLEFKEKWFARTPEGRAKEIADKALARARKEIYDALGIKDEET